MSSTDQQPGYYGPPPGDGYDARPTSVAAIIGLIGAVVFWPVGLVASIIGIVHTKPGRKKGRRLAIAGLIVSVVTAVVATALIIALVSLAATTTTETSTSTTTLTPADPDASAEAPAAPQAGNAAADVALDACTVGAGGIIEGSATITNSTDSARSYLVTVSANGADGNRVAELSGAANSISPGQSATVQLIGAAGDAAPAEVNCVVANVSRF